MERHNTHYTHPPTCSAGHLQSRCEQQSQERDVEQSQATLKVKEVCDNVINNIDGLVQNITDMKCER